MEFLKIDSVQILCWNEDVTLKTANLFESALQDLTEKESTKLIIDLQDTKYMNSAGLGLLVDAVMKARKDDKQIVVTNVNPLLMEIFNIVKIGSFIKIFASQNEAIEFMNKDGDDIGA